MGSADQDVAPWLKESSQGPGNWDRSVFKGPAHLPDWFGNVPGPRCHRGRGLAVAQCLRLTCWDVYRQTFCLTWPNSSISSVKEDKNTHRPKRLNLPASNRIDNHADTRRSCGMACWVKTLVFNKFDSPFPRRRNNRTHLTHFGFEMKAWLRSHRLINKQEMEKDLWVVILRQYSIVNLSEI